MSSLTGSSAKILFVLALALCCLVELNEANPSAAKFEMFKCRVQCMTYFDMCVSQVGNMNEYVICYHAQSGCKATCKHKFGDKLTKRSIATIKLRRKKTKTIKNK